MYYQQYPFSHGGIEFLSWLMIGVFAVLLAALACGVFHDIIWPVIRRFWCNCKDCREWRGGYSQSIPQQREEPRYDLPSEYQSPGRDWPFK